MRFNVRLRDIVIYHFEEIEAESQEEAIDIAWDQLNKMTEQEKNMAFFDSDGEADAEQCLS